MNKGNTLISLSSDDKCDHKHKNKTKKTDMGKPCDWDGQ